MTDTRVVYLEPNKITIETVTLPDLKPTQVLVKTYQASICGSERYYFRGINVRPQDEAKTGPNTKLGERKEGQREHAYPMGPLGHEGGGAIVEMGSAVDEYLGGGKVKIGDRVGSLIYPTYTDYWATDIRHVQPIPEGVSFEVGCLYEPLGCAGWAAIHMGVKLGDTVAVNGVGFAGNIMLQGALKSGASQVIAALFGGVPVCHGSGGLTAHYRLGARTGLAPVLMGSLCLALALFVDGKVLPILALIPYPVLGTLLAFVGVQHALLARDVRGWTEAGVVLVTAAVGFATRNLAIGCGAGIILQQAGGLVRRLRARQNHAAAQRIG